MKDDDPLHTYAHVWAWPYVIAGVAFSIMAFLVVYGTLNYLSSE